MLLAYRSPCINGHLLQLQMDKPLMAS